MATIIPRLGQEHHALMPDQVLEGVILTLRDRQFDGVRQRVHKANRPEGERDSPGPGLLYLQGGAALEDCLLEGPIGQLAVPNLPVPGGEHVIGNDHGAPDNELLPPLLFLGLPGDSLDDGDLRGFR